MAVLGISFTMWSDREAWKTFLLYITGFCVLALVGRGLSSKIPFAGRTEEGEPVHPSELEPSVFPGVRIHFAPVQHCFGRSVIAMIAVTAMLSACAGYLYSRAATTSGHAAAVALEQQENGFKTGSLQRATSYLILEKLDLAQVYRAQMQDARQ